jgi:3-isopropylmalate/(R)-2-methylmalate dehydratase small subunit
MKKKFECQVRHLGDDVPASQIGGSDQVSNDLFSGLADATPIKKMLSGGNRSETVIVAGKNFGNGDCEYDLFLKLKKCGTMAIIANSFSRDFYRAAINHGIAVIESPDVHSLLNDGEMIFIDFENSEIKATQGILKINPMPDVHFKIYLAGGLIPYTRKLLGK